MDPTFVGPAKARAMAIRVGGRDARSASSENELLLLLVAAFFAASFGYFNPQRNLVSARFAVGNPQLRASLTGKTLDVLFRSGNLSLLGIRELHFHVARALHSNRLRCCVNFCKLAFEGLRCLSATSRWTALFLSARWGNALLLSTRGTTSRRSCLVLSSRERRNHKHHRNANRRQ